MDETLLRALRLHYASLLPDAKAEAAVLAHTTLMYVASSTSYEADEVEFHLEGSEWLRAKSYVVRSSLDLLLARFSARDRDLTMSRCAVSIRYPAPHPITLSLIHI